MIDISEDRKSGGYVVTKTDAEGFHTQITLTVKELYMMHSEMEKMMRWKNFPRFLL